MVNKVILIGNLGADPEVRQAGSVEVAEIRIATTEKYKDKQGQKVENTEWHSIELWDGLAKVAAQYLRKGDKVYIEGKIKTDSWETDGGEKRYRTKIRANNMTMLGGKSESGQGQAESAPVQQSKPVNPPVADFSDDLPF